MTNIEHMVNALKSRGLLNESWETDQSEFLEQYKSENLYIRSMTIIGAWLTTLALLAAFFLSAATHISHIPDHLVRMIVGASMISIVYLIGSIHEFSNQLRISFSLIGQVLFFAGLYKQLNNIYLFALFVVFFESLLLFSFREMVLKIFSVWVVIAVLAVALYTISPVSVHILTFACVALYVVSMLFEPKWSGQPHYLLYESFIIAAGTILLIFVTASTPLPSLLYEKFVTIEGWQFPIVEHWYFSGLMIGLGLCIMTYRLLDSHSVKMQSLPGIKILSVSGLVALVGIWMPGFSAGVLVAAAAYDRGFVKPAWFALGFAVVMLCVHVIVLQYSMQTLAFMLVLISAIGLFFFKPGHGNE